MAWTTERSRVVLIVLSLFVVITPHHRCSAANMAWDRLVSVGRLLTISWFWLLAHTAPTFILHVLLQVYRKPTSIFTTYRLPADRCSRVVKYLQPTGIEMERTTGYRASDQSRGRSLRAVATAGGRWSLSVVKSPSWHSATVVLSQASYLRDVPTWFQESHVQLCVCNRELSGELSVFSAVCWSLRRLDVCICTGASDKGFASAVREGCPGPERTRFKRSSRSIRARSRALRSIALEASLESSSSDEDVMSLARRESRADFPEVSLQLLDPWEWKLAA